MLHPASLVLAAAVTIACLATATTMPPTTLDVFAVPTFDFSQLAAAPQPLLEALQADGIVSLKNIPNYAQLRATYLREATQCALAASDANEAFVQHKTLNDGTQRFTLSTTAGKATTDFASTDAAAATAKRCPTYAAAHAAFSQLVETAVETLGQSLDTTAFRVASHEELTGASLLGDAIHLDHFHAYEAARSTNNTTDDALLSLDLHTDNGLLIAMTAPTYLDVTTSTTIQQHALRTPYESGLLIENRSGKLVRPSLQENELVIMIGAGFQEWIASEPALRPVPHAMKLPQLTVTNDHSRLVRAWFGKMVLLAPATRMLNVGTSFEAFAKETARFLSVATDDAQEEGFVSLACPRGRRLMANDKSCVVKTCFPKPGKDPALACSIQCNTSEKSRPGAERLCAANCDCEVRPSNVSATYCWTLCSAQLPASECGAGVSQRCRSGVEAPYIVDQGYICNVTASTTEH